MLYTDEQLKQLKSQKPAEKSDVKSGILGFGQTLGTAIETGGAKQEFENQIVTDDMANKLALQIHKMKKSGKDTTRAEQGYKMITGKDLFSEGLGQTGQYDTTKIYGDAAGKTNKQVFGEGLSTLNTALLGSGGASSALGRMGQGAAFGASSGLAQGLEQDKDLKGIATETGKGFLTGAIVSGLFETAGYGLNKLGNASKDKLNKASVNIYNKELQVPVPEVQNAIKNHYKTMGEEVRDVLDNNGKPVYVGNYGTLLKKAEGELTEFSPILNDNINRYSNVTGTRSELVSSIGKKLENQYAGLSETQQKQFDFLAGKLKENMTVPEMEKAKRTFDGLMKGTDWGKIAKGDTDLAFATAVKYEFRDGLRRMINEKTNDPIIQAANNRIHLAMEMRDLVSKQEAQRAVSKTFKSGGGGFFGKFVDKIVDDFVLNPAITTRASQKMKNIGNAKTGNVLKQTSSSAQKLLIKGITDNQKN